MELSVQSFIVFYCCNINIELLVCYKRCDLQQLLGQRLSQKGLSFVFMRNNGKTMFFSRFQLTDTALLWLNVVLTHVLPFLSVLALYASAYPSQTWRKSSMCLVQMIVSLLKPLFKLHVNVMFVNKTMELFNKIIK